MNDAGYRHRCIRTTRLRQVPADAAANLGDQIAGTQAVAAQHGAAWGENELDTY
jgi:hypothetical protein